MRLTRTTLKELAKRYRAVLLKCALINAGICIFASMNANAETTTPALTLNKIKEKSGYIINNDKTTYELKSAGTVSVKIGSNTYYYSPELISGYTLADYQNFECRKFSRYG